MRTHTHIHKCVFLLSRPELLVLKSLSPGMCPSSLCQLIQRVWYKQNILAVSLWVLGVWFKIRARDEFPLLTDEFYTDPQSYMSPPLTWRHPKLIHSPKRMLHFFPPWFWILVDPSLFKIILPSQKREGDVEKWEWGINWQRFLQVLQMQCITICLWNVSYFQSVFNSFPNMTHCSSQARGSDVEALRREARLWSAARKWHPRACAERRKTFTLLRCSLEQTLLGLKLLVASYRVITRCMCLSVRCLKVVANINKHLWGCPAWSVDSA